jgi:broad specificity phosphatase PhoE
MWIACNRLTALYYYYIAAVAVLFCLTEGEAFVVPSKVKVELKLQESRSSNMALRSNALLELPKLSMQYFVLRHGQSLANVEGIISSDPSISTVQHGLSEAGQAQARKAGQDVCQQLAGKRVAIWSSDFLRARETAQHVADAILKPSHTHEHEHGVSLYQDQVLLETRLRERFFGTLNGGPDSEYPSVWKYDALDSAHEEFGVESVDSVMTRTTQLVTELNAYDQEVDACILVAHGDVLQIIQTAFQKWDGRYHRQLPHLDTAVLRPLHLSPQPSSPPSI